MNSLQVRNTNSQKTLDLVVVAAVLSISLVGAYLIVFATSWGPWAYSDSVEYFEAAHNWSIGLGPVLIRANGSVHPIYLRPPLYSIVLGSISTLGMPLISAARGLDVVLFFSFTSLLGLGTYWITRQALISISISLLTVSSLTILQDFTGAMSEPLCFFRGFSSLFILLASSWVESVPAHSEVSRRAGLFTKNWLPGGILPWLAALLAGGAFLARYSGFVFIAAGAVYILDKELIANSVRRQTVRRLAAACGYAILGLAPFLIWTFYLRVRGESPGTYEIAWKNLARDLWQVCLAATQTIWSWVPYGTKFRFLNIPEKMSILAAACLLLAGLAWMGVIKSGADKNDEDPHIHTLMQTGFLFSLFAIQYIGFIAFTYIVVKDPKPALNDRVLSPILPAGFLGGSALITSFLKTFGSKIRVRRAAQLGQLLPLVLALLFLKTSLPPVQGFLLKMHFSGMGYTSQNWQRSPTIQALRGLTANISIIASDIDPIVFFLNRPAYRIPELETGIPAGNEQAFGDLAGKPASTSSVEALFHNQQAVLVIFSSSGQNPELSFQGLYGSDAAAHLQAMIHGLYPYFSGEDGSIYFYKQP